MSTNRAAQVSSFQAYAELLDGGLAMAGLMAYVEYTGNAPTGADTADSLQVSSMAGYAELLSGRLDLCSMMGYVEVVGTALDGPRYGPRWQ